jgi:oxygen-independent coproporphyrinogen-3 oxidase
MNALRLAAGVPTALYPRRTGLPTATLAAGRARGQALGLLDPDPVRLAPTDLGWRFLNRLIALFAPD